jgi:hypothetical protein
MKYTLFDGHYADAEAMRRYANSLLSSAGKVKPTHRGFRSSATAIRIPFDQQLGAS